MGTLTLFFLLFSNFWECVSKNSPDGPSIKRKQATSLFEQIRINIYFGFLHLGTWLARILAVVPFQLCFTMGSKPIFSAKERRKFLLFSTFCQYFPCCLVDCCTIPKYSCNTTMLIGTFTELFFVPFFASSNSNSGKVSASIFLMEL